ncbi:hypothetical protein [Burkholderia cepacia]|uniref:hypothetical protein n=1 Tax=Burkholderia cepacia TaxID=292 RepID=UPI0002D8167B|nr:hypothetical protein [Burkholderia cepacia]
MKFSSCIVDTYPAGATTWMTLDVVGPGARHAAAKVPKQAASGDGNVSSASFTVGVMGPRRLRAGRCPGINRRLNTLKRPQGQRI